MHQLDPRRFLQVLHWPIRAIRFITDPVVDLVLYLIARTVVPPLSRVSHAILESSARVVSSVAGESLANKGFDLGSTLVCPSIRSHDVITHCLFS